DVHDALLPEILDAIFLPIGLQYTVDGKRVIVSRRTATAQPQTAYRIAGQIYPGSNTAGTSDLRLSELKKGAVTKEAITRQANVTVARIQIATNRPIPTATIRSQLQTKVGDPIRLATISRDIQALYSLGFFDDIQFETENDSSGTIITFSVKEKPLIRAIQYKGP